MAQADVSKLVRETGEGERGRGWFTARCCGFQSDEALAFLGSDPRVGKRWIGLVNKTNTLVGLASSVVC